MRAWQVDFRKTAGNCKVLFMQNLLGVADSWL